MARIQTPGLFYFPLDVTFFDDKAVKRMRARYGADASDLYLFILTEIYRYKGYYVPWETADEEYAASCLCISPARVAEIRRYFVKESLFSDTLYHKASALSSDKIQMQYAEAVKERAKKVPIRVDASLWLVPPEQTPSYIRLTGSDSSGKNDTKEKETKEEEITAKQSYAASVLLRKSEYDELVKKFGVKQTEEMIDKLSAFKQSTGRSYLSDYNAILSWVADWYSERGAKRDTRGKTGNPTFDAEEFAKWEFERMYGCKMKED